MPTNEQNIAMIRARLGNPLPNAPDDQQLLRLMVDQLSHHSAQLVNTRNHWSVDKWVFTAQSGLEDYLITANNFGRPFVCYTIDLSDPYHVRREIPFSLLQDADKRYQGPQMNFAVTKHSAVEMVFYRKEGQGWFLRPVPIPGDSSQYEIWYETMYEYGALGDTPGASAFHHLVRVQAAIAALPFCHWRGVSPQEDAKTWQIQMAAIRDSLLHDEQKFQRAFDIYKSQISREGVNAKLGYANDYEYRPYPVGVMVNGYGF